MKTPLANYPTTQPFKPATVPGGVPVHTGVDKGAPAGTPITIPYDAVVIAVGKGVVMGYDYGNWFEVRFSNGLYGFGAHLNWYPKVGKGDHVDADSTVVGYVGNTGLSKGYHLHWSIFKKHLDRTTAINPVTAATPGNEPVFTDLERRMRTEWLG